MDITKISQIVTAPEDIERLCWFVHDSLESSSAYDDHLKHVFVETLLPFLFNVHDTFPLDGKVAQVWLGYPVRHAVFVNLCKAHLLETDYYLASDYVHSMKLSAFRHLMTLANTRRSDLVCGYVEELECLLLKFMSNEVNSQKLKCGWLSQPGLVPGVDNIWAPTTSDLIDAPPEWDTHGHATFPSPVTTTTTHQKKNAWPEL